MKERVVLPDLDTFKRVTEEYDRLKHAGVSIDEMHMLMKTRIVGIPSNFSGGAAGFAELKDSLKDEEIRSAVMTAGGSFSKPKSTKTSLTGATVLLIDDSAIASKVASKVLQRLNFQVLVADSAQKGFNILKEKVKEIRLIFLDVVMPQVDGVECLTWIKDDPSVAHIPVYMLSGLEDQTLTDICIEKGAARMFMKPLNVEIINQVILEQDKESGKDDFLEIEVQTKAAVAAPPLPAPAKLVPSKKTKALPPPDMTHHSLNGATVLLIDDSAIASKVASKVAIFPLVVFYFSYHYPSFLVLYSFLS